MFCRIAPEERETLIYFEGDLNSLHVAAIITIEMGKECRCYKITLMILLRFTPSLSHVPFAYKIF